MTTGFQVSVPSSFPDPRSAWAATASLELLNTMSRPSTTEEYFGGVVPTWQYIEGASRWRHRLANIRPSTESTSSPQWHHLEFALDPVPRLMGSPRVIDDKSALPFTSVIIPHHAFAEQSDPAIYASTYAAAQTSEIYSKVVAHQPGSGAKPFVLLERARRLLSVQRIREARDILQFGAASYPEDMKNCGASASYHARPSHEEPRYHVK